VTNTLAYYNVVLVTALKGFIIIGHSWCEKNSCNRILYNFCLLNKKQIFQFIDPKTSFHNFFCFLFLIISSLASDLLYCIMVCTDFQHCGTLYWVTTLPRLFIQHIHLCFVMLFQWFLMLFN
jgi:hypothetical protein